MRHLGIAATFAFAAGLALAGCGDASPTDSPAATITAGQSAAPAPAVDTPDPCALVTASEVSAALGATSGAGTIQPGGLPGQRTCAFDAGSDGLATVGVAPGGKSLFDRLTAQMGASAAPVPGIGEGAVRDVGQLTVVHGQWVLFIFVSGKNSDSQYATATTILAKAALSRL